MQDISLSLLMASICGFQESRAPSINMESKKTYSAQYEEYH